MTEQLHADAAISDPSPSLYNEDLAATAKDRRTWSMWNLAALWASMAICIPTYMLASTLIEEGMSWWQANLTVALGNLIVLIPILLNAHAGVKYGVPFPVFARASFGVFGANIPAMLRAIVACGWFGIQTWIGGWAIYQLLLSIWPNLPAGDPSAVWPGALPFACFMVFWAVTLWFILRGTESIKWMETIAAPFLILVGLALLFWAVHQAKGWGPMLNQPGQFKTPGEFFKVFVPGLTAMVGFWATLSLNIPDFTRFARSQRDQIIGQALGLPTTMTLFAFIGSAVTSATIVIYGKAIWDPVLLVGHIGGPAITILAIVTLAVATLSTNIAANVVSPANDFSNLAPKHISFRTGGIITAIIGILIMPWRLYSDPKGYIFTWLVGYSALLGPIGGILICDYFVIRAKVLNLRALYRTDGEYRYEKGYNLRAMIALGLAILPNVPGFVITLTGGEENIWTSIYYYAWFNGFILAFLLYYILMKLFPPREAGQSPCA